MTCSKVFCQYIWPLFGLVTVLSNKLAWFEYQSVRVNCKYAHIYIEKPHQTSSSIKPNQDNDFGENVKQKVTEGVASYVSLIQL